MIVAGAVILREVIRHFRLAAIEASERDILYGIALEAAALGTGRGRRPPGRLHLLLRLVRLVVLGEPPLQELRRGRRRACRPLRPARAPRRSPRGSGSHLEVHLRVDRVVGLLGDLPQRRRRVAARATTSRTSVLRVMTPLSCPSSVTKIARTSGRASSSPASTAGRGASSVRGPGPSPRAPLLTGRSPSSPARPRPRGSPTTSAALRRVRGCCWWASSQTRSKASFSLSTSLARISSRFQNSLPRSCTHSKYETVTPPAFVRTSGRTVMPRSARISSAPIVVGPFAPSATSLHATRGAFSEVSCSSRAARTRMSHGSSSSSEFETCSASG